MDTELRNHKLKDLHEWLSHEIEGYLAMCEAGSTTAGDPWVEGFSDRDICIIVDIVDGEMFSKVQEYLGAAGFNDCYLFNIYAKDDYLSVEKHALSHKFRGQDLFGQDILHSVATPTRETALQFSQAGLTKMQSKLQRRLLNAGFWSEQHLREKFYPEFKHFLMFLAAEHYARTGEYPRRRVDVAKAYNSNEIRHIADTVAIMNRATGSDIIRAAEVVVDFLKARSAALNH